MTEACRHDEDVMSAEWGGGPATMYCAVCWPDPAAALIDLSRDLIGSDGPPLDEAEHHREVMFQVLDDDQDLECEIHSCGGGEHKGEWWFFLHGDIYAWDENEAGRLETEND